MPVLTCSPPFSYSNTEKLKKRQQVIILSSNNNDDDDDVVVVVVVVVVDHTSFSFPFLH